MGIGITTLWPQPTVYQISLTFHKSQRKPMVQEQEEHQFVHR